MRPSQPVPPSAPSPKPLLAALSGVPADVPPVWLMRQAGRYLPEYRALRKRSESFLDFCYTPEFAIEATLQPMRRFDLDAAIVFSDILVIPDALGRRVRFEEGLGPKLDPISTMEEVARLWETGVTERLEPVYATISGVREGLPDGAALIGFAGAPWTIATYMVEGGTSRGHERVRKLAYDAPGLMERLIGILTRAVAEHLIAQARAGAEALQIFDSWAGTLPATQRERYSLRPIAEIASAVRASCPDVPVIAFPRGVGTGLCRLRGGPRDKRCFYRPGGGCGLGRRGASGFGRGPGQSRPVGPRRRGARRWRTASTASCRRSGAGRSSSISDTVSYRKPRRSTLPPWSPGSRERGRDGPDGGRPVQSRGSRPAGVGKALPVQSLQRPGDYPTTLAGAVGARPGDLVAARAGSGTHLPAPRRSVAVAGTDRGAGPGARPGAGRPGDTSVRQHALLASDGGRGRIRGRPVRPRQGRAAAPLPAVLVIHHRVVVPRLGSRGTREACGVQPRGFAAIRRRPASSRPRPDGFRTFSRAGKGPSREFSIPRTACPRSSSRPGIRTRLRSSAAPPRFAGRFGGRISNMSSAIRAGSGRSNGSGPIPTGRSSGPDPKGSR